MGCVVLARRLDTGQDRLHMPGRHTTGDSIGDETSAVVPPGEVPRSQEGQDVEVVVEAPRAGDEVLVAQRRGLSHGFVAVISHTAPRVSSATSTSVRPTCSTVEPRDSGSGR